MLWTVIVHCIYWSVWLERSRRIFDSLEECWLKDCWDKIKIRTSSRIEKHVEFKNSRFQFY